MVGVASGRQHRLQPGLTCALPLAAFAAAAALSMSRRDAVLLILLVWLANQLVGFTVLDYPWTVSTFAWGAALGIVAILATMASQWTAKPLAHARRAVSFPATFLIGFTVYESILFAFSATFLGRRKFTPRPSRARSSSSTPRFLLDTRAEPTRGVCWPHEKALDGDRHDRAARLGQSLAASLYHEVMKGLDRTTLALFGSSD
jgi:hypothetical protein